MSNRFKIIKVATPLKHKWVVTRSCNQTFSFYAVTSYGNVIELLNVGEAVHWWNENDPMERAYFYTRAEARLARRLCRSHPVRRWLHNNYIWRIK